MTRTLPRSIIFSPFFILAISFAAALALAGLTILWFTGEVRTFLLYYFVPIAVPFVTFLFDRAQYWTERSSAQAKIDLPVILLALLRAGLPIPLISGHALFLSYALFTTRSPLARGTAFLVLIEAAYVKIFMWHDITFVGGVVLGIGAAFWFRNIQTTASTEA